MERLQDLSVLGPPASGDSVVGSAELVVKAIALEAKCLPFVVAVVTRFEELELGAQARPLSGP